MVLTQRNGNKSIIVTSLFIATQENKMAARHPPTMHWKLTQKGIDRGHGPDEGGGEGEWQLR